MRRMPDTWVSGCPAGQTAATSQPCRCRATANRADKGHHFAATINTDDGHLSKAMVPCNHGTDEQMVIYHNSRGPHRGHVEECDAHLVFTSTSHLSGAANPQTSGQS